MGAFLALINPIASLLDRVIPDKTQAAAAKAALLQAEVQGEFASALAQLDVDKQEAASQSVFVAGWRPFVGWVCGSAFAYAFIIQPFLQFGCVVFHWQIDMAQLPKFDISVIMPVLLGMLGLGVMRSYDKSQGTGSGH